MTHYLLDANVFIEAKNRHYGFDFCPAFWDWLVERNQAGAVASIDKVADELRAGQDDLADWAAAQDHGFFLRSNDALASDLRAVSDWVSGGKYQSHAVVTFMQAADYWLVAHALVQNCIVVTHEARANTTSKIKIPNVCKGFNLDCINPFEMLRRERARFVLEPSR